MNELGYKRTRTLWEGRYKSCLVQEENYLLQLYRYIELNPVRENMVDDPAEYSWSSYQINALGKSSQLCTAHSSYISLGPTNEMRKLAYQALFKCHVDGELLKDIRGSINKGMALGNDRFKQEIKLLTGRSMTGSKRGRPIDGEKRVNFNLIPFIAFRHNKSV